MKHERPRAPALADEYGRELSARPGIFERRGVHPMRAAAVEWVRAHPDAARALPGWTPEVLESILRADERRELARDLVRELEATA